MAYYERILADIEIFEKPMYLDIDEELRLMPMSNPINEKEIYFANSNSEEVKKYLPGAYVNNVKEAEEQLVQHANRFLVKQGMLYNIVLSPNSHALGYICLHSPLAATKIGEWSLDFWLHEKYRNRNIMLVSLFRMLKYMQQMQIKRVAAIVDSDNIYSRKLLENLNFGIINEENSHKQILYGITL